MFIFMKAYFDNGEDFISQASAGLLITEMKPFWDCLNTDCKDVPLVSASAELVIDALKISLYTFIVAVTLVKVFL